MREPCRAYSPTVPNRQCQPPPMLPRLEGSFLKPLCRVPPPKSCYFNNLTQSTSLCLLHQAQTCSVTVARPTEGGICLQFFIYKITTPEESDWQELLSRMSTWSHMVTAHASLGPLSDLPLSLSFPFLYLQQEEMVLGLGLTEPDIKIVGTMTEGKGR